MSSKAEIGVSSQELKLRDLSQFSILALTSLCETGPAVGKTIIDQAEIYLQVAEYPIRKLVRPSMHRALHHLVELGFVKILTEDERMRSGAPEFYVDPSPWYEISESGEDFLEAQRQLNIKINEVIKSKV